MPKLRFLLLSRCVKRLIFLHLDNETDFSAVAEIGDTKSAYLLNKGFPCELKLILSLFNQVLNLVWLQLHYATNAQLRGPFTLV